VKNRTKKKHKKDKNIVKYKEGRKKKKKTLRKVQTPRFWVLTLLTERLDARIMHAQVDDKSRHALLSCDTFLFCSVGLAYHGKDIVFKFIIEYNK